MKYPVVFTYVDQVETDGWSAIVTLFGRSLMAEEDDEWWAEGVEPGGMAGHGPTPTLANKSMHESWSAVLEDLAGQASDLNDFSAQLHAFVAQVNAPADAEWLEFRRQVQAKNGAVDGPFADVPQVTGEVVARVMVEDVSTASVNEFESLRPAA